MIHMLSCLGQLGLSYRCRRHHSGQWVGDTWKRPHLKHFRRHMNVINNIKPLLIEPRRLTERLIVLSVQKIGHTHKSLTMHVRGINFCGSTKISTSKILGYMVIITRVIIITINRRGGEPLLTAQIVEGQDWVSPSVVLSMLTGSRQQNSIQSKFS